MEADWVAHTPNNRIPVYTMIWVRLKTQDPGRRCAFCVLQSGVGGGVYPDNEPFKTLTPQSRTG